MALKLILDPVGADPVDSVKLAVGFLSLMVSVNWDVAVLPLLSVTVRVTT